MFLVYFNIVRNDERPKEFTPTQKFEQDLLVVRNLRIKHNHLSRHSLYLWWFPNEIQVLIEPLMSQKPSDTDVSGLLSLILFAGIDLSEKTDDFFQDQIIEKVFLITGKEKSNKNLFLFESQQNLASLLFGITVDKVCLDSFGLSNSSITNRFATFQSTRFLNIVRECCHNKKALVNNVLKRKSQKPTPGTLKLLRYASIEVIFRLCMMFLTQNKTVFSEIFTSKNKFDVDDKIKFEWLSRCMYPLPRIEDELDSFFRFGSAERLLGHDLLVKAIMATSKTGHNKRCFSADIPAIQWNEFVDDEKAKGYLVPDKTAIFMRTIYKNPPSKVMNPKSEPKVANVVPNKREDSPRKQTARKTIPAAGGRDDLKRPSLISKESEPYKKSRVTDVHSAQQFIEDGSPNVLKKNLLKPEEPKPPQSDVTEAVRKATMVMQIEKDHPDYVTLFRESDLSSASTLDKKLQFYEALAKASFPAAGGPTDFSEPLPAGVFDSSGLPYSARPSPGVPPAASLPPDDSENSEDDNNKEEPWC